MPADPTLGFKYARQVRQTVEDAEGDLLRLVSALLKHGDGPDWVREKTAEAARVANAAREAGERLSPQIARQLEEAVKDAYTEGMASALPDLKSLGVQASSLPSLPAAFISSASQPAAAIRASLQVLPQVLGAAYSQAVAAGAREVLGGQVTRLQASQHVLDRLLSNGITGFTDKAGRSWTLGSYVEMAVRTTTAKAAVQGHINVLQANGLRLVKVSDAPRECPLCRPWEGKILALDGVSGRRHEADALNAGQMVTVDVAATLEEAQEAGLQHPNCRHSLGAYVPGATYSPRPQSDPDGYDAGQRQREMERNIRNWKRRKALALTPEAEARATAKVRAWQSQLRSHIEANGLKRLSYRESV